MICVFVTANKLLNEALGFPTALHGRIDSQGININIQTVYQMQLRQSLGVTKISISET